MRTARRRWAWIASLLATLTAAGTVAAPTPAVSGGSATLTPLVLGWESYFKVEWEAAQRNGRAVVRGIVLNDWGFPAARVQLLIESLDERGAVVGQRVAWLGAGILTPGSRAYFEEAAPRPAPSYRVRVFAFEWVQAGGDDRR